MFAKLAEGLGFGELAELQPPSCDIQKDAVDAPPQDPARWLLEFLADGPRPVIEIKRLAQ